MTKILIETTARHLHISEKDRDLLLGQGSKLTKLKNISQPGQFASRETIDLKTNKGKIKKVRIVGPERETTQVEISRTDARTLGINPPIKECVSCRGKRAENITLIGPQGEIKRAAAIIPQRHIHLNEEEAKKYHLSNHELVSIKVSGKRALTFHNVLIRVDKNFSLAMHIDTDEANAAGIEKEAWGVIIKSDT